MPPGPSAAGVRTRTQRDDAYLTQPAMPTVLKIKLYHESLFRRVAGERRAGGGRVGVQGTVGARRIQIEAGQGR